MSEEYPFRHQKNPAPRHTRLLSRSGPKRIRLCAGPPPCAAIAQATWYNNGHRKGRSSDNMDRREKREVKEHDINGMGKVEMDVRIEEDQAHQC